jgi:mannose-6-phosphate isomerase-like protein (cupin superfamily)
MKKLLVLIALGLAANLIPAQAQQAKEVRRVVTGLDANGKAVAIFDGAVPLASMRSPNPAGDMWITKRSPTDYSAKEDWAKSQVGISPPSGGTIFRIVEFPPTSERVNNMDVNTMMKVIGEHAPQKGLAPRHSMMHRTRSLDYVLIMSGEIDMLLDDTEVHLKAGDVAVQQATNHAWVNRGKEPCRIAFILMDAQEP